MITKKLSIFGLAIFSLFILSPAQALETGTTAPDFELTDLQGEKVRLSDFKGNPIILKLATTWCGTCKQQTEELEDAGEYLAKNNVRVVEVFVQDSQEMVKEHLADINFVMPHTVLLDDGNKVLKAYNVFWIPRVLVIDENFKIRRDGSLLTSHQLRREISRLKE